jgi:peroxiredoxin
MWYSFKISVVRHSIQQLLVYMSIIIVGIVLYGFTTMNTERVISDFSLMNVDGKVVSLKDYPKAKGFIIIFTCNHCPFAKLYPPRINDINAKYKSLDVPLIAISSTDTISYEDDTYRKMREKATREKFNFPYLFDGAQTVAKDFKAQKTPHAYVIWKVNGKWVVKYNGAIDDNGMEPEKVKNHYVTKAVEELLSGREVSDSETKSIGCQIYLRRK